MPLRLTAPIIYPSTISVELTRRTHQEDDEHYEFVAEAYGPANVALDTFLIWVTNDQCRGLRAGMRGLSSFTIARPNGYTDLVAAMAAAADKKRAALQWMSDNGILPPGTTT